MRNNAHEGESKASRLQRFQNNPPLEAIETLLSSIDNFMNNEIRVAAAHTQTSLLFLGVHAASLTISEVFFNKRGQVGYKKFLEYFVDGKSQDTKFSYIADTLHDWRNVLAHQWIGSIGHKIGYNYKMTRGWEQRDGITYINPRIYGEQYLLAFSDEGRLWKYEELFSKEVLEEIRQRIVKKYIAG